MTSEENELIDITNSIIDTLDPLEKDVIVMQFGLMNSIELSIEQIAEKLRVSTNTVKEATARALRKLRHPSRSRRLSELFPDTRKAAETLTYIQQANLPFEEAMHVIETELPSFFPEIEKVAKSNEGLLKLIAIILPIILFFASQAINRGGSTHVEQIISNPVHIEQNILISIENKPNNSKRKPSPKTKKNPKKADNLRKPKKPCE